MPLPYERPMTLKRRVKRLLYSPIRLIKFCWWHTIHYLFYKRVFIAWNLDSVSRAEVYRADFRPLFVDAICIFVRDLPMPYHIWDISHLSKAQFKDLKDLADKAVAQSTVGV